MGTYARECFSCFYLPSATKPWKSLYIKEIQGGGRWVAGGSKLLLAAIKTHSFVVKNYRFHLFSLRENDVFPQGKRCILSEKTMYSFRENDESLLSTGIEKKGRHYGKKMSDPF